MELKSSPFEKRGFVVRTPKLVDADNISVMETTAVTDSVSRREMDDWLDESERNCSEETPTKILRGELKTFLYNDINKVNRNVIKFIMSKWSELESRLHSMELENGRLTGKVEILEKVVKERTAKEHVPVMSYAAMTAKRSIPPLSSIMRSARKTSAVQLIRPKGETETKNNDEIKESVCKMLKPYKYKLKIKSLRKMKNKGLILEIDSNKDVEIVREIKLETIGLRTEAPRKTGLTIMIYDVDKDMTKKEMNKQLWDKEPNGN